MKTPCRRGHAWTRKNLCQLTDAYSEAVCFACWPKALVFFRTADAAEREHCTWLLDRLTLLFGHNIPERRYLLIWCPQFIGTHRLYL